eukprot:TRINITY_DN15446_c0_g1_i1.p1 TRINITY_DN15446_c0_g1~~TRINITY_DN15446_c0_g1_i1.p1  ORF type:complete len:855 (+),score=216.09 TRINITY_DN15446_c0_g1_i1:2531-5095(+)
MLGFLGAVTRRHFKARTGTLTRPVRMYCSLPAPSPLFTELRKATFQKWQSLLISKPQEYFETPEAIQDVNNLVEEELRTILAQGQEGGTLDLGALVSQVGADLGYQEGKRAAIPWFKYALELGNLTAAANLSLVYKGQDWELAKEYAKRGAALGDHTCAIIYSDYFPASLSHTPESQEAVSFLLKGAEEGSQGCMIKLGGRYFRGVGVPVDKKTAVEYLVLLEDVPAFQAWMYPQEYYFLGFAYWAGHLRAGDKTYHEPTGSGPCEESKKVGLAHLELSIAKGCGSAAHFLGDCYLNGKVVAQDTETAQKYLRKGVDLGVPDCLYMLAMTQLVPGKEITKDLLPAFQNMERAHEAGSVLAKNWLGYHYYQTSEFAKSAELYREVLKMDPRNPIACYGLGSILFEGREADVDTEEAVRLIKTSAQAEMPRALALLGDWTLRGQLVPFDYEAGIKLLERAAELGNPDAASRLVKIYLQTPNTVEAAMRIISKFLQKAGTRIIEEGHVSIASSLLAFSWSSKVDDSEMLENALTLLKRAKDSDSVEALRVLGITIRMLPNTPGITEEDKKHAVQYLERALVLGSIEAATNLLAVPTDVSEELQAKAKTFLEDRASEGSSMAAYVAARGYLHGDLTFPQDVEKGLNILKKDILVHKSGHAGNISYLFQMFLHTPSILESAEEEAELISAALKNVNSETPSAEVKLVYATYLAAKGTPEQQKEAFELLKNDTSNDARVLYLLACFYLEDKVVARDVEKAVGYLRIAAEAGHEASTMQLSTYYWKQKNVEECVKYTKMSADRGNLDAMFNLALMYIEGFGEQNVEEAMRLLKLGAERGHEASLDYLHNLEQEKTKNSQKE